jgi:hypothetical protein
MLGKTQTLIKVVAAAAAVATLFLCKLKAEHR